MKPPVLSVLMPAYNVEKYVCSAIDSILTQSFVAFELLIADDGSSDMTRELINKYSDPRIKFMHNEKNIGKVATVEKLYKETLGKYITIHDADDISDPKRFQIQINELENDHDLIMCGVSFVTIDALGNVIEENSMETDYNKIRVKIRECSQFHGPTMIFRKSATERLGEVYRRYFRDFYEDTDLAYRLVDLGKAYNLKEILYTYRVLPDSICRKNINERNRNLYKVVAFLGDQREKFGNDCLMRGKPEEADAFFAKVLQPYNQDKARIHREAAAYLMYWKFHKKAIAECFKGIRKRPFSFINWRTLFYCFRKTLLK